MKEYAEQNWKYFKNEYPELVKKIQEKDKSENVWTEKIENDEKVIALKRDNRVWYLNSRLDPLGAAKIYSERYENRIYLNYLVFGLGDGKHIRKLLENCDETNRIIVFEPSVDIFKVSMNNFMLIDLLKSEKIAICFTELQNDINGFIKYLIADTQTELIEFCILPGYDMLFPDICRELIDKIQMALYEIKVFAATRTKFKRELSQNTLFHMKRMITECNINQVKEELADIDLDNAPVFIVSAGPSLDKNINELKNAQGKSLIIVVDGAVRTISNAGIKPDLIVSIDANAPCKFFEGIELNGMNWICANQTRPWILQNFTGKIFYYGSYTTEWDKAIEKELGYTIDSFDVGGSVSTVAFAAAIYFGFKKIVLVGQDLAFTGGRSHTIGAVDAIGDSAEYINKRSRTMVEGLDGEMIETDTQMFIYKKWFERKIAQYENEITVIDATEGGAKILGAENRTLRETIGELCTNELDLFEKIHGIEPKIGTKGRENLYKKLKDMKNDMLILKGKLANAIEKISRIKDEFYIKKGNEKKEKELLIRLKKINNEMGRESLLEWLQLYAAEEENDLFENIYIEEEMDADELINRSLKIYEVYYKKTDLFFEDYEAYAL